MAYAERHVVHLTTATGGTATGYTPVVTGRVAAIRYVKATAADAFASTVDFTIESDTTGQTLWAELNVNASKTARPFGAGTLPSGAASTISEAPIYVAAERIKIGIAEGGNTKQGTFHIVVA